jgi:hypothetical protein
LHSLPWSFAEITASTSRGRRSHRSTGR